MARVEVSLEVPEPIEDPRALERAARAAREAAVLELYDAGEIGSGYAGELLGMHRVDFLEFAGARGVPTIQTTPEQLDEELATLDRLLGPARR